MTVRSAARALSRCEHCGLPAGGARFCCAGCEAVHAFLQDKSLSRFYELRSGTGLPVTARPTRDTPAWVQQLAARVESSAEPIAIQLDLQGIHCAGCVWLIGELFDRFEHGLSIQVNPGRGRLRIIAERGFDLAGFCHDLSRVGYRVAPVGSKQPSRSDGLTWRLGVCVALAINTMMLAAAVYFGLRDGVLFELFSWLTVGMGMLSVAIGGSYFFAAAYRSLRAGVINFEVPISLGIVLVAATSIAAAVAGRPEALYFDSLTVFIALLLVGRWLQDRVLRRNRDRLLSLEGPTLMVRRIRGDHSELVAAAELSIGDDIRVPPGDVVPCDVTLADDRAGCRLDWLSGESDPRVFRVGDTVPAGAINASRRPLSGAVSAVFDSSELALLLRPVAARETSADFASAFAGPRLSRYYLGAVVVAALVGFVPWLVATGDWLRALEIAAAVFVVTCPCAFGLASPLAYEMTMAGLARAGVFIRRAGVLVRALTVKTVAFDKTGTLTSATLSVTDPAALDSLPRQDRSALLSLAIASNHPRARAIASALEADDNTPRLVDTADVEEHPGLGISGRFGDDRYQLGSRRWVTGTGGSGTVVAKNGVVVADIETREQVRVDADRELETLRARGLATVVLSGDRAAAVADVGERLGFDATETHAELAPSDKAAWVSERDHGDLLFVGDGVNDSLAADQAHLSASANADHPFLAGRSDFYFVTPGVAAIRHVLDAAGHLRRIVRRNLGFAIVYNAAALSLAWAGLMRPWLAAVLMPLSSVVIVTATVSSITRSAPWRS